LLLGRKISHWLLFGAVSFGLYLTTFTNYLLFHGLVEVFSIVVAFSFFTIAWNSRSYIKNQYLLFVGIAYFFIAILDLLHTLSYKGMPIFSEVHFYANQLWIGARYLESISLVVAFYFMGTDKVFKPEKVFLGYAIITAVLVASIFYWKVFPVCFLEGLGQTTFKQVSEYVISSILLIGMALLYKNKNRFSPTIYRILMLSIICTIIAELAFAFYISNYGFSNLVGHYFKLFSFSLIYLAIVETGLKDPYKLIFNELDSSNKKLVAENKARVQAEKEKEKVIQELQAALAEVKTLSGLLPICSFCKKVRDDKGYWNQIESYVAERSDAKFSHSVCQDCLEKHYPDL